MAIEYENQQLPTSFRNPRGPEKPRNQLYLAGIIAACILLIIILLLTLRKDPGATPTTLKDPNLELPQ